MSEHIEITPADGIQTIRMNRPDKKNAITRAMYRAMAGALREGEADETIRVHVFLGVPGAFSAGNDLADFLAVATGGEVGREVWEFLEALASVEKPVLSGVDGIAVGIGTTLNLHCDLSFATPRTVFRTPFVDLGLVPEAASSLLAPNFIGHQRAFALLCMGEAMTAEEARESGLIARVVGQDELEAAILKAAARLAAKPGEALRISRALLKPSRDEVLARIREEGRLFAERLRSDEARRAFQVFMARKG
ncbi:MAG: crotonase/enoyl-CoA hydratase family protein [Methylobacterium mesophilicum]|nr:crotonase/enoyl-CoA hydratase family protein [Methylobacterium mesophilicum]